MEWLRPLEDIEIIKSNNMEESLDFKIQELILDENFNKVYSVLTQFFLLLSAQDMSSVTSLYFPNNIITEQSLNEVIAHFDSRKVVLEKGLPVEVILSKPSRESLSYISSNDLNPVIKSLFSTGNNKVEYEWRPQNLYKLLPEFIEKYENKEFDQVLDYLETTSKDSLISLLLFNWTLEDSLKESIAIRYFAHKCTNVYLWVDTSKRVTLIQLEL